MVESSLQEQLANSLIDKGIVSPDQLAVAKVSQKNYGTDLSDILIKRGYVSKEALSNILSEQTNLSVVFLDDFEPSNDLLGILPYELLKKYNIVPYSLSHEVLTIALSEPLSEELIAKIKEHYPKELNFVLSFPGQIGQALHKYFQDSVQAEVIKQEFSNYEAQSDTKKHHEIHPQDANIEALKQSSDAVKLVDSMLMQCVKKRASDMHIEPNEKDLRVRLRVDGRLTQFLELPLAMHQKILSRIKILANIDVAENRRPQDGSTNIVLEDQKVDLRIATFPTIYGEAAAIRISLHSGLITLESLGLSNRDQKIFEELVKRTDGIVLVTGPTGSGKTTSLYAALQKIDCLTKHVLTAEDPAEHHIAGVVQTEINSKAGVTFPVILRSMLRQDPDVIMVGEIRDKETAEISLRAAMTGHLVLSTLHTNTAVGAIARLNDIGLDTYLVASTLRGVMAQRLVRKLCQKCKVEIALNDSHKRFLGAKASSIKSFGPKGCLQCNGTGYHGRIGLFELVNIDEEFRILIGNRSPEVRLQEKAAALGCKTILEDGIDKIEAGLTTVEEVLGVCWRQ